MQLINKNNLNWFLHTCIRDISIVDGDYVGMFKEGNSYFRFDTAYDTFFQAENGQFFKVPEYIYEEYFLTASEAEIQEANTEIYREGETGKVLERIMNKLNHSIEQLNLEHHAGNITTYEYTSKMDIIEAKLELVRQIKGSLYSHN